MSDHHQTYLLRARKSSFATCCLLSAMWPAACTVGPDFSPPETHTPESWVGTQTPQAEGAAPSAPTTNPPDIARWWTSFNDDYLNSLIERAIAANIDLRLAESRLRQARAARAVTASGLWPTVDASAAFSRARSPGGTTANSFRAGFDAAWEIDVFGGTRRAVEAADAGIVFAVEDRRDVLVTVTAEVATTYYDLRGIERQLAVARDNLAVQEQTADITRQRYEGGFVSGLDASNAQAQVYSTRSQIPSLEASAQQARYALAVLLGLEPGALLSELPAAATLPVAPPEVPIGLPSDLLRRRPDIRRAEAQLHGATANIGAAVADFFPRFALNGSIGVAGSQFESLTNAANRFWSFGPSMSWNIFSAGRTRANVELQKAARDQAFDAYRQTVLVALQDVESSLVQYTREQERRAALVQTVDASKNSLDLANALYSVGRTDFLNVLTAQRALLASQDALAASDTAIITDLVAIYKALGGGWEEPPSADMPAAE